MARDMLVQLCPLSGGITHFNVKRQRAFEVLAKTVVVTENNVERIQHGDA
jgi:hypothetical protein